MKKKKTLLNEQDFKRIITRISHEIIEKHRGTKNLALVGIQTRGDFLAKRIADQIKHIENVTLPVGSMDINMYRDDWTTISRQPTVRPSNIPFSVDDMDIILVDDVLFTGRTIRAAMDALIDFGRPKMIQLAVLIDRGHRELPIRADYVGKNLPSSLWEAVSVHLLEKNGNDEVVIEEET